VFLSSHVLSEIQQAADEVAILRDGRIVIVSDVESLRETAIRRVRVGIMDAAASAVQAALAGIPQLTDLKLSENGELRVEATVEGNIDPFVKAIARFTVSDLALEEPDLEESVLRLYSAPEATDEN
jgi:ABC-2 type transport system ATP-binding protein